EAAARRLGLRPRDDRPRGQARPQREDRLAGAPARRGRPCRLHLLLSVRTLRPLSEEGARGLSLQGRPPARAVGVPALPPRLRRVLLPEAGGHALQGARRAFGRAGGSGELRALAGDLRLAE